MDCLSAFLIQKFNLIYISYLLIHITINFKVLFNLITTFCLLPFSQAQYNGYSPSNWEDQLKIEQEFLSQIDNLLA